MAGAAVAAACVALGWSTRPPPPPQRHVGLAQLRYTSGGALVRRPEGALTLVVDDSLLALDPKVAEVVTSALVTWSQSGAPLPGVTAVTGTATTIGYSEDTSNANDMVFLPAGLPEMGSALAFTITTSDAETGAILDADIVISGENRPIAQLDLAAVPEPGATIIPTYDLQSIVTHEMGHWFGLGEDMSDLEAAMYIHTKPLTTYKRALTADDRTSITDLYTMDSTANMPGCNASPAAAAHPGAMALTLAALVAFTWRRRRSLRLLLPAVGLLPLLLHSTTARSASTPAEPPCATTVEGSSRWEGGLIKTDVTVPDPNHPGGLIRTTTLGGTVGHTSQMVFGQPEEGSSPVWALPRCVKAEP